MKIARTETDVVFEMPEARLGATEFGGMTIETGITGNLAEPLDPGDLFKGLPDDRCQCPHWGYVLKGALRYRFADHEEVFEAGDCYYAPPGHLPVIEANTEYVEFSPCDQLAQTMAVVGANMAAAAH